ncbi:MAG: tRNA 4-thiouridine(8) synthase ThiI [Candidatus Spechtbacteria bacterium]|nr:tRNA 4-thiouridine(8) synthase ThiI [Candidatus Spechtbacteria bacterium]
MIIIHYNEIGLKGGNRKTFENLLAFNIKKALSGVEGLKRINVLQGRIVVEGENEDLAKEKLSKVFGIANFSFVQECKPDLLELKELVWSLAQKESFMTFKIQTRRAQKNFHMTSMDIDREVGAYVQEKSQAKVQMQNPDLTIYIEVVQNRAYVYTKKYAGPGGLPVGSAGRVVSLISSGIDSPVASWKMMKRGCTPAFVHFHSYPQTSRASLENVQNLMRVLEDWSPEPLRLYAVAFLDIQKLISAHAPDKLRVILYRRSMIRIASHIARDLQAHALVTGESVGQVASQTLENIAVIDKASDVPILRPNIGEDKQETIAWARRIKTYDISTQPYEDCCSLFVPLHPETKARIGDVEGAEANLGEEFKKLEAEAIENLETPRG